MKLSITIPTRNRLGLWRSGWLLSGLRAQTDQRFEAVIVVDHSSDDTTAWLEDHFKNHPPRFSVTLCEVLIPIPGPCPASCIPDNIGVHAATGEYLLHLDDDMAINPELVAYTKKLPLSRPTGVWALTNFCRTDGKPVPGSPGKDVRLRRVSRSLSPPNPLSLVPIPPGSNWGGCYATQRELLLSIGGGDLTCAGYHTADTRLGARIANACGETYLSLDPHMTVTHLGTTWCRRMKIEDPNRLLLSRRSTAHNPLIANGGEAYWKSEWFSSAYRVAARFPGTA